MPKNSPSRLSEKMLVNPRNPDFGCVRARILEKTNPFVAKNPGFLISPTSC